MRGSGLESLGTGPPSRGLSTVGYYHYGSLEGQHTGTMVFHVLRLSVRARLNLAVFCLHWGLSGSIFTFRVTDALLTIYTFFSWYS